MTPLGWLPAENARKRPTPSLRRIDSARIERALFPVHRNRTLKTRSTMLGLLGRPAGREVGDQRRANLGSAAAAVLEKEQGDFAEPFEIGAVEDRAALPLAADETGASQYRQMRRHCILRNANEAGQLAGGYAQRLVANEQPERVEAGDLRQRRQCVYDLAISHISRIDDIN